MPRCVLSEGGRGANRVGYSEKTDLHYLSTQLTAKPITVAHKTSLYAIGQDILTPELDH